MCAKCAEIDRRIEHLLRLGNQVTDQQTLRGIVVVIAGLETQKAALHPNQK